MKLFTKHGCAKCDWLKDNCDLGKVQGLEIIELSTDPVDALATIAYNSLVEVAKKTLPILQLDDGENIIGVIKIKEYLTTV